MVFLPVPFQSSCWVSWNNVASSFGCFCVQERTAAGEAKNESIGYRLLSAEEDLKPFRIIYTTVPADFALNETDRQEVMLKSGGEDKGSAAKNTRSVVAVSNSLAAILADWGWLVKAWPAVYTVTDNASSSVSSSGKPAPTTPTLSEEDWKPVYLFVKERYAKGGIDPVPRQADDAQRGSSKAAAPPPALTATAESTKKQMASQHSVHLTNRNQDEREGKGSTLSSNNKKPSHGTDISSAYFDVYDAAVLQFCDIFAWRSPQLSLLILLTIAFGGHVLCRLGSSEEGTVMLPWPSVFCVLLCASLPTTHEQTHRRRVVLHIDLPADTASGEVAVQQAEACALAHRISTDERRLKVFAKLARVSGHSRKKSTTNTSSARKRNTGNALASPVTLALAALFLLQLFFTFVAPRLAPSAILNLVTAPAVVLALAVTGALHIKDAFTADTQTSPAAVATKVKFVPVKVDAQPTATAATSTSHLPHVTVAVPTEAVAAAAAGENTPMPIKPTTAAADRLLSPAGTNQPYKYRLPALTDKEDTVLQQLANYGAPFSMVLLKCLREWNQVQNWERRWERDGVRCEERVGHGDTINIRLTANIPNTNVGSLQAILLDDPDFLDAKSTFAYQYTPLLSQRCVVKRLAYNMYILLSRHRSPVCGMPPLELLHYMSPAILLDPEQQEALQIRRPLSGEHNGASEVVMPLDVNRQPKKLMTFVQCSIPCPADLHPTPPCQPPHVRGATEISLIIGMEEADGSLTLGAYTSVNPKGLVKKEWESVYRSIAFRKAGKIAELLGQEGPQPSKVAVYRNQRDFQPYLDRQALSEPAPQKPKQKSCTENARRAANLSREAQYYTSGNALFTADMEPTMPTPTRAHGHTFSGTFPSVGVSGDAAAVSLSSSSCGALPGEAKWPKLPHRFVQELLTLPGWTPESSHLHEVKSWSCQTSLCPRKATASMVFVPDVSLSLTEAVLLLERLSVLYNPLIERRVTVTSANLQNLLMNAAVTESPSSAGDGNDSKDGQRQQQHLASLPSPDFPRDSYHGCSIHYTQFRSPMWGVAPRDVVTRVSEPYYFTAGDARQLLFPPDQFNALPPDVKKLPASTKMFLFSGEDASEVLPPMKQYQRGHMFLFGYLCWEQEDDVTGRQGVSILFVNVADVGGTLLGKLADKSIADQQQVLVKMKELLVKISSGDEKISLL